MFGDLPQSKTRDVGSGEEQSQRTRHAEEARFLEFFEWATRANQRLPARDPDWVTAAAGFSSPWPERGCD
jgi:hypothetical protein